MCRVESCRVESSQVEFGLKLLCSRICATGCNCHGPIISTFSSIAGHLILPLYLGRRRSTPADRIWSPWRTAVPPSPSSRRAAYSSVDSRTCRWRKRWRQRSSPSRDRSRRWYSDPAASGRRGRGERWWRGGRDIGRWISRSRSSPAASLQSNNKAIGYNTRQTRVPTFVDIALLINRFGHA